MLARNLVVVWVMPGIGETGRAADIRAVPFGEIGWRSAQRLQSFFGSWIATSIEFEEIEASGDVSNFGFCRAELRAFQVLEHSRRSDHCQKAKNCKHYQQFDQ